MTITSLLFLTFLATYAIALDYTNQAAWPVTCTTNLTRQSPIDIPCKDFINTCPSHISYQLYWDDPVSSFGGSTYQDLKTFFSKQNLWTKFSNSTNNYIFKSAQFHFHHPSEHTINGAHYPIEMHIVHLLDHPTIVEYLVIGIFFQADPTLTYDFLDYVHLSANISSNHLFPFPVTDKPAYHYLGSLTTPPCTQAVNWFVQIEPIKITQQHLTELQERIGEGHPNNRLSQNLNSRQVYLVGQGC